jgi:hypothetical protein
MSTVTDDDTERRVMGLVKSIYRAILHGFIVTSPGELAHQHYACLLAGAGLRLKAAGYRAGTPGGDAIANELARAAQDAMEATLDRMIAERN